LVPSWEEQKAYFVQAAEKLPQAGSLVIDGGELMRRSTIVVATLAVVSMSVAVTGQSPDALMGNHVGSWVLNVAKSTYSPGPPPKSNTIKWEPWQGGLKMTTDGIDAKGQATHSEIIIKFDGKDYPYNGGPEPNTSRAYKRIDDRTYEYVEKTDGKVTTTTRVVAGRNGKTRTSTTIGKDAQGRRVTETLFYDKQ
jgi:hypothetical protein